MGPRAHLQYVVESRDRHWSLSFEGEECGWFRTRKDAVDAAIHDCRHTCELGNDVSVLVRDDAGRLTEAWRYDATIGAALEAEACHPQE